MGSQYEEDRILSKILPLNPIGYYVDVGANHPWKHSNTAQYYLAGWSGLLIEPNEEFHNKIRVERPNDILCVDCVSDKEELTKFRIDCKFGGLSSLEKDWIIEFSKEKLVKPRKLSNILSDYPTIRDNCKLCSIDVEGHEKNVLQSIDFTSFKPDVFIVEAIAHKTGTKLWQVWEPILLSAGYSLNCVTENTLNRIYTRNV